MQLYFGPERRQGNRPPITYRQSLADPHSDDLVFAQLWDELEWLRLPGVPRREYFCNTKGIAYTYGTPPHARTYQAQLWHPVLLELKREAEALAGCEFDALFLNGYENERDQLGWHSDDSPEMDPARPIVITTFGAERDIMFRRRPEVAGATDNPPVTLLLEHGSSLVMGAGMQQTHQHRIPKCGHQCGPRVSLTFRGLA